MDSENEQQGKKVDEVTVGSVTIEIFQSRNSAKVRKKPAEGSPPGSAPEFEIKYYDSFLIPYYEGSIRKIPRRSTLEKARKLAKEVATRLNKDVARSEFLSERDRRIYILARVSANKLGLDVDVVSATTRKRYMPRVPATPKWWCRHLRNSKKRG